LCPAASHLTVDILSHPVTRETSTPRERHQPRRREQPEQAAQHLAQQRAGCGLDPAEARQRGEIFLGDGEPFGDAGLEESAPFAVQGRDLYADGWTWWHLPLETLSGAARVDLPAGAYSGTAFTTGSRLFISQSAPDYSLTTLVDDGGRNPARTSGFSC
jgi:hypothetical protein